MFVGAGVAGILEAARLSRIPAGLQQTLAPGYYILGLSVALVILGGVQLLPRVSQAATEGTDPAGVSGALARMFAALAGYTILIPLAGYPVASFLFFLAAFRIYGVRSWLRTALLSALYAGAFYAVFVVGCDVVFPRPMLAPG